jgi:pre-rRNA-processing protein TSR3
MRSSGSTPSPSPRPPIRLLLLLAGEDHPKACTGRRLLHRGWVRAVSRIGENRSRPIVLDPHAPSPLSGADRPGAREGGLLVVDCSWNRLAERGSLPGAIPSGRDGAIRRRLPILVAANPQHYGRLTELNTVEALAAGLFVLGYPAVAAQILEGFRGGDGFLEINRERLERYRAAASPDEVRGAERALFGGAPAPLSGSPPTAARSTDAPPSPRRGRRSVR